MKETGKSLFPWATEVRDLHEAFRTYVWANGDRLTIKRPKFLVVSDNGHRLADENNRSYYVAYGWLYLFWENEDKEQYQFYYQR